MGENCNFLYNKDKFSHVKIGEKQTNECSIFFSTKRKKTGIVKIDFMYPL